MIRIATSACFAFCLLGIPSALAQRYPSKPIRLITPYPPGGGIDASARIIGQALAEQMNQQVIIDNRPGATGRIGTEIAAKAPADGYTLLLGSVAPNAIIPGVLKVTYDAIKDFTPISLVGTTDYTLVVHPSLPARSVTELIALAKANPGKLTFASSGILGASHLGGELLNLSAKVDITHVAYKGIGPAALSVLTGETVMSFAQGTAVTQQIKARRLRALASTGSKRRTPDLPTMSETLPGYNVTQWFGILAPTGTPRDVLDRLHKEIVRAVANHEVARQLMNADTAPVANTPEGFSALIRSDMEKWARVIKLAKIPVE